MYWHTHWFWLIALAAALLVLVALSTGALRFAKTALLILRTEPYERALPGALTILILGDSTGYGTGVARAEESVAGRIAAAHPTYAIENDSANGRTIGELLPVIRKLEGTYELIVLQIGGNDLLQNRNPEVVRMELATIFSSLQEHTEHIVMLSTGNVGAVTAFGETRREELEVRSRTFRQLFMDVAGEHGVSYVDLFEEPEDDVFLQDPNRYLSMDGLHPSGEGYGVWFSALEPVLDGYLRR